MLKVRKENVWEFVLAALACKSRVQIGLRPLCDTSRPTLLFVHRRGAGAFFGYLEKKVLSRIHFFSKIVDFGSSKGNICDFKTYNPGCNHSSNMPRGYIYSPIGCLWKIRPRANAGNVGPQGICLQHARGKGPRQIRTHFGSSSKNCKPLCPVLP